MVDKPIFVIFQISARSKAATPRRDHLIAALHQVIVSHHSAPLRVLPIAHIKFGMR